MRYLIIFLFMSLLLTGCENTKQSIGINAKPFTEKAEESVKFNWKVTWGSLRPKEDSD